MIALNALIDWVRYSLIIAPSIASMYLESYPSHGWYVCDVLLLLSLVELRRAAKGIRAATAALLLIEIIYAGWMSNQFHGILYMYFFSTLLSVSKPFERIISLLLGIAGINIAMAGLPPGSIIGINLLFISLGVIWTYLQSLRVTQLKLGALNDELRRKHYQLDEAQKQLLDYARMVENTAQLEERNRISKDIHDELGHKLIRLKLMMDAAVHILPSQPVKGLEMADTVRAQLVESMDMLRATVRNLKPKDGVLRVFSLETLVQELHKDGGLTVRYEIAGLPYPLYPSVEVVLYRNAQEAITNAIRHGSASEVAIHVTYEPHQVKMEVSNNGTISEAVKRRGLGLSGMEERTTMLGGTLLVDAGFPFTVHTTLPTGHEEERRWRA